MGTLLICLLALPSGAGERGAKSPGTVSARRAAARPSAMAVRRANPVPFVAASASAQPVPAEPAPATPAAAPAEPVFGPRITPPLGSPTAGIDLRKDRGVAYSPAAPTPADAPHPPVGADGAGGPAPSGVKGSAVVELKVGRTDRQFGGSTDPVLFLMGGTSQSGSINTASSSSSESLGLTVTLGAPR